MHVVTAVAAYTGLRRLRQGHVLQVTGTTAQIRMHTRQHETGFTRMVESSFLPIALGVARPAFGASITVMNVIYPVAIDALCRSV